MKKKPSDVSIIELTEAGAAAGKLAYEAAVTKNATYPNIDIEYGSPKLGKKLVETQRMPVKKIGIAS